MKNDDETPEIPAEIRPETPIDEAMKIARESPSEGSFFYDAFLNSDLFMPVQIADQDSGTGRTVGWDEKFFPMFLKYGDVRVVSLFDRLERLNEWAGAKTPDYLLLRCHVLLKTISPGVGAVLNLGTPWVHYFSPDLVERLRQSIKNVTPA